MSQADNQHSLLVEAFPKLSEELQYLLGTVGEPTLAAQVPGLLVLDRCRCADDFCATFYVRPKLAGSYGPNLRTIPLEPTTGMLIIDVLDGMVASVEVLYRDEVRQKLLEMFP